MTSTFNILLLFLSITYSAYAQDLNNGLVAKYEFNGSANDIIGTNHGTVQGASLTNDRFDNSNSAYSFDGVNDYIEIAGNELLDFGYNEDFSISIWVNISSNQNDLSGHNNEIIGKWNALRTMPYPYAIRYWNKNASEERKHRIFNLRYDTETCNHNPLITGDCYISSDEWHHLVFLKRGSTLEYYQDGLLFGTTVDNTVSSCNTINSNRILIGRRTLGGRYFTGLMDDLLIYDRALEQNEIGLLFNYDGWTGDASGEEQFLSFNIPNEISNDIDYVNNVINIIVSCDTDLKQITPNFNLTNDVDSYINGLLQESGVTSNDFSNSVIYLLSNLTKCSKTNWTVNINLESNDQEEIDHSLNILSFNTVNQVGKTIINHNLYEVIIYLPCNADLSSLKTSFTLYEGSIAIVNDIIQESNESINDFNKPVTYSILSGNKCFSVNWKINIKIETLHLESIDLSEKGSTIPNVITPNNDNFNDRFEIGELFFNSEVKIFNRHGVKVYENSNYNNEFSGESLASGQYYYIINTSCFENSIKGYLNILK